MPEPLLRLISVSKRFGNTRALNDVSLNVEQGEVISLVGENGAGKSTLMKVLAGIVSPDHGQVQIDGVACQWTCPGDAIKAGIALIHQELSLHDNLTIAENLFLGRELTRGPDWLGWLDRSAMRTDTTQFLDRVGLSVSPDTPVSELPIASKQLVEIARALSVRARVVVMDEPTSSLSEDEAERLIQLIGKLKEDGVAIIYISHRLAEVIRISDRIEVLRDGCHVRTLTGDQIDHDLIVESMVGRELASRHHARRAGSGKSMLVVEDLRVGSRSATPICFQVAVGEVVALVGLVGSGRTEILETIFGVRPRWGGRVRVADQEISGDVNESIRSGIALVPEDRKQTGLLIQSDVRDNATLVAMGHTTPTKTRGRWISRKWQSSTADGLISQLRIKTASNRSAVASLSGGNQQKVALAKWLALDLRVLMLDEPTRGVDIGAKAEIYELIDGLARDGLAVLVVSSEMEEVFAIADRVLVISQGRIAGELGRDEMSEEAIMHLAVSQR
ncbi:sugar ABC transporter ATP-binding protein [Neorhodopirellula pilleata]|uniref:Xylose import ATP-binding protein XylG n=1 Tax=Neorhodopirellula pilleata TaxID=2714738 RepID=A0A5C6AFZ1_9BACT|nr:sugar ABC transporter ATP-binding protein [Neorhodopirellula pilleata]TWT98942.1 Xylose import ATP-binding protein XylG [Neorhodopirellula pilleata]